MDYGQAAVQRELSAAQNVAQFLEIPLQCIRATGKATFTTGEILGRNTFLISAAFFLGPVSEGLLVIGIHAGVPYYDCTLGFLELIKRLVEEQSFGRVTISAPLLKWSKAQVHQYLMSANLPLDHTYSCETGETPKCGVCPSCRDREALGC